MTEKQIEIVRLLQEGLPISKRPYDQLAEKLGMPLENLLHNVRLLVESGYIRRVGAFIRHHEAGYCANSMVVWRVPEENIDSFAETAAALTNISHCYQRPSFESFDYNIYTMVHGRSEEECRETVEKLVEVTGIEDNLALDTVKEYKKTGPVYFASYKNQEVNK